MHAEKGEIFVRKGLGLSSLLSYIDELGDKAMVIHMRYTGGTDPRCCHPFKVTDNVFMCHNGQFNIRIRKPDLNDTWHFANDRMRPVLLNSEHLLDRPEFIANLGKEISSLNKVVFLRNDGKVFIVNKQFGVTYNGLWLSNTSGIPNFADNKNYVAAGIQDRDKQAAGVTCSTPEKKTDITLGTNPEYIQGLTYTLDYYGLTPAQVVIYKPLRDKYIVIGRLLGKERKQWHVFKSIVEANVKKTGKTLIQLEEECRKKLATYYRDCTMAAQKRGEEKNNALVPVNQLPVKVVQGTKWTPPSNTYDPNKIAICCKCSQNTTWRDSRVHTWGKHGEMDTRICDACWHPNGYTHTPQVVVWKCSTPDCKVVGYVEGGWSDGTKEAPICSSCVRDRKEAAQREEVKKAAKKCGINEDEVTVFEYVFWKNIKAMKGHFPPLEAKK